MFCRNVALVGLDFCGLPARFWEFIAADPRNLNPDLCGHPAQLRVENANFPAFLKYQNVDRFGEQMVMRIDILNCGIDSAMVEGNKETSRRVASAAC
jgi:hypothetical protein